MTGELIDQRIKEYVQEICSKKQIPNLPEYLSTDNIGEILDKLIILHIRTWMLEDLITPDVSDEQVGIIKRKIDLCFKQKRPRLIEAFNKLMEQTIKEEKSLFEENVKMYK